MPCKWWLLSHNFLTMFYIFCWCQTILNIWRQQQQQQKHPGSCFSSATKFEVICGAITFVRVLTLPAGFAQNSTFLGVADCLAWMHKKEMKRTYKESECGATTFHLKALWRAKQRLWSKCLLSKSLMGKYLWPIVFWTNVC